MDKNTASKIIKELINTPKHNNSFIIDLDKRKYDLFQVSKNSIKLINKKYNSKEHDNNKKYDDIKDGGVREGPFWVLVGAQMPSVLVEVGFISHPKEATRLMDNNYRKTMAKGLADGIERYFANN